MENYRHKRTKKRSLLSYKGPRAEKYRGYPVWANTRTGKKKTRTHERRDVEEEEEEME